MAVIDAGQLSLAMQDLGGAERAGLVNAGQVVLERSAGDGVGQHGALGTGEVGLYAAVLAADAEKPAGAGFSGTSRRAARVSRPIDAA